jgi:ribonuclease P protein component
MILNNEQRYHFGKDQKLISRKLLQKLFAEGKHINAHPLKAIYLSENEIHFFQAGVSVSSRHFKKAVDRNRIKRLMREALRLQKNELEQLLTEREKQLSLFLIYTGKDLPEYKMIFDNCTIILKKLIKTINASH